jgi:hypothetical protein
MSNRRIIRKLRTVKSWRQQKRSSDGDERNGYVFPEDVFVLSYSNTIPHLAVKYTK